MKIIGIILRQSYIATSYYNFLLLLIQWKYKMTIKSNKDK